MFFKFLIRHVKNNFDDYEHLLKGKQSCYLYRKFNEHQMTCAERVFLIERFRHVQKNAFYENYNFAARSIDLLLSVNAKFRLSFIRLLADLVALYIQTITVAVIIIYS